MGKAWEHLSREVDVGGGGVPGYVHINPECEFCYWSRGVPFVSHTCGRPNLPENTAAILYRKWW